MKLEKGMYVRTVYGKISKIVNIQVVHYSTGDKTYYSDEEKYPNDCLCEEEIVKKASHNIIDLIEVGDYVNGYRIVEVNNNLNKHDGICNSLNTNLWYINENEEFEELVLFENKIKSIVTKEQFSQREYKVGK